MGCGGCRLCSRPCALMPFALPDVHPCLHWWSALAGSRRLLASKLELATQNGSKHL